jgi:hypothetical protein
VRLVFLSVPHKNANLGNFSALHFPVASVGSTNVTVPSPTFSLCIVSITFR